MTSSTPLPSREGNWAWAMTEVHPAARSVLEAFVAKDLMTAEEWRATLDYGAGRREWDEARRIGASLPDALVRVIDAALGDTTND